MPSGRVTNHVIGGFRTVKAGSPRDSRLLENPKDLRINLLIITLVLPRIMNCVIVGDEIAVGIGLLEI
jgi:hypothetical protein